MVGRIYSNKKQSFSILQRLLDRPLQYYLTLNRESKSRLRSKDSRHERKIQSRIFSLKGLRVVRESRTVYATPSRIALEPVRIRNAVRFVLNSHQRKIVRDSTGFRQLFVYRGRKLNARTPISVTQRQCFATLQVFQEEEHDVMIYLTPASSSKTMKNYARHRHKSPMVYTCFVIASDFSRNHYFPWIWFFLCRLIAANGT